MTETQNKLREGFTTGTAATAAGMAALQLLLSGERILSMRVPMPPQEDSMQAEQAFLDIAIADVQMQNENSATAYVIKDGGDDPDATHNAHIYATVQLLPKQEEKISIEGGEGVGRITLPGLPLPVGMAAINPAPRRQIAFGLGQIADKYNYHNSINVVVHVPKGEKIAKNTFNPRLGIVGGISILGTQGTVKPYSNSAWRATIMQGLEVAKATGCSTLCLSTGRRSERLLLGLYPDLSPQSAIQAADFAEFSLQSAGEYPFDELIWGCFFGKLVKLAQGHSYTHARHADLNFELLRTWCKDVGADIPIISECVTANHALEYILEHELANPILQSLTDKAAAVAADFAGKKVRVHLFHLDGRELARAD